MHAERLAVVAGWQDTRTAFARWNADVAGVVRTWAGTSFAISCALLVATWAVAHWIAPSPELPVYAFSTTPTVSGAAHILGRNSLVLAMHALICVAGYMAASSVPIAAQGYSGWTRRAHLAATPVAFAFVAVVTISSFSMQAWSLGHAAPGIAQAYDMPVAQLLLLLTPHAIPELVAMFLPLGAWLVLARRGAYSELFAASVLAVAVALPVLVIAGLTEEYLTPLLVRAVAG